MAEVLKTHEAAEYLNVSRATLFRLRQRKEIRPVKRRQILRWPVRELQRWLDRNQER